MKTTILKILMFVFVILSLSSCSSDDDDNSGPNYTEENFLDGYLEATGFDQALLPFNNGNSYELGLDFAPLVKGKITALKVKLPVVKSLLRVTIWDKATTAVLRTEVVDVTTANTEFTFEISDLELVKDNEYTISMNTDDWYIHAKSDGSLTTYPIIVGNIQINGYKWGNGTAQTYPTNISDDYYAGDLSFNFLQTE